MSKKRTKKKSHLNQRNSSLDFYRTNFKFDEGLDQTWSARIMTFHVIPISILWMFSSIIFVGIFIPQILHFQIHFQHSPKEDLHNVSRWRSAQLVVLTQILKISFHFYFFFANWKRFCEKKKSGQIKEFLFNEIYWMFEWLSKQWIYNKYLKIDSDFR